MKSDDFQELIDAFGAETQEFLQSMETNLLAMESANPEQRSAIVKEMFRAAHSIKGVASMMGFADLATAAHALEDCFAILRDRADLTTLQPQLITLLLQGVDRLKGLANQIIHPSESNLDPIHLSLEAIAQIQTELETLYGKPTLPPISPTSQSPAPETLKAIFEYELPTVFSEFEAELSQASDADLEKTLAVLDRVYYQLSGVAGMLQLPELGQIMEPLRTLIDRPDLNVEQLQGAGWTIAQNLQTARQQILDGQAISVPVAETATESPPIVEETAVEKPELTPDESPVSLPTPKVNPGISPPNTPISTPQRPTIRVDLERLTELVNLVGELVINRTNLELQESELRSEVRRIRRSIQDLNLFGSQLREEYDRLSILEVGGTPREKLNGKFVEFSPNRPASVSQGLDALEMDRYGEFHSTAQEVIETTEAIAHSASKLDALTFKFERSTDQLRRITEQLRSRVMQLRVVSFSRAVDHLPRALRDMCLTYNKDVNLLLLGRDTKIDESLLDALRDPLVHLVRNAFDHGIEPPEVRQAAGKPASGQIEIEARHQGGQTLITISDDGRGIDPEAIRRKAIEKGLATEDRAQELAIHELYEYLFWPGFSTSDTVSNLSGRGVGLDVVRSNLRAVRGTVKVDSRPGKGTTFILKLPLLLSIAEALLVRTDRNTVALPLDAVEEIIHLQASQIHMAGNQPMIWWREEFIRLVRLQELLHFSVLPEDLPSPNPLNQDHIPVLAIASSEGIIAVAVERLIGQQEIVVKPLPPPLSKPRGILGSTILGDGRVVTIVDVDDLVSHFQSNTTSAIGHSGPLLPPATSQAPQILIVDDSYTIRQLLSLTLTRARYRVVQAKDGLDALEKLQQGLDCSLIIADIEMPRMDGFELLRSLKSMPQFVNIPVAMLTSRSGAKHRRMALELGAIQYFTKPYGEAQLLEMIASLVKDR